MNFIKSLKSWGKGLSLALLLGLSISSYSQDLGNGFYDHGVTSPISNHRGTVSTTNAKGEKLVLMWLMDHRGGYSLLEINITTGKSSQYMVPFKPADAPYSSILSSRNKFYTLFASHFIEFDVDKNEYTFEHTALPSSAMTFTEDTNGVIWGVTYPKGGVISFNPHTREFKDYGSVYTQNWNLYPRSVARDKSGWVYFALGNTYSQIIAFNPTTGQSKPMLEQAERKRGIAYVYLDMDGHIYGQALHGKGEWFEFSNGERKSAGINHIANPKLIISSDQGLFYTKFADGSILESVDLVNRVLTYKDAASNTIKTLQIEYKSEGAWTMGTAAAQDGRIVGGTSFPMRFFSYDPKTNARTNPRAFGQFNALGRMGDKFYFGVYAGGHLLEWDPKKPWVDTKRGKKTNPELLITVTPVIHRPFRILPYPSQNLILMSGSPEYGYTGGGLLFWNVKTRDHVLLKDSAVVLDQSTISMVGLPNNKFLGGTTTTPGTGGEKKANLAELYCMDVTTKKIEWRATPIAGVQEYSDLCHGPGNLIYGIADKKQFFVFDPVKRAIVYQGAANSEFGQTTGEQSPRIFVMGPNKQVFIIYEKAIVKVNPNNYKLELIANSPVPIHAGGDYLNGKIYFISGSHLCSYTLK